MVYLMENKMEVGNIGSILDILERHKFNIQKKFGQNFLIDNNVLDKIIATAEIGKEDVVLEIGPGMGALTQKLCQNAYKVLAVEIDKNLIPILDETLGGYDNVKVINQDILKVDLPKFLKGEAEGKRVKVVANLPYYITTQIVMTLLESDAPISSITIMVQKEVAERMQEGPGTKDYGALSVAVTYRCDAHLAFTVSPNCFVPKPNVDSAVIHLKVYEESPVKVDDEAMMFKIVKATFMQRRKTMVNSLTNAGFLNFSKEQILETLEEMGRRADVRGESFTVEDFALFTNLILKK